MGVTTSAESDKTDEIVLLKAEGYELLLKLL